MKIFLCMLFVIGFALSSGVGVFLLLGIAIMEIGRASCRERV